MSQVTVRNMRRGYIEVHCPLADSFELARFWAGSAPPTLIAPSTRAVEASPWLERAGIPIGTVGHRHSRFDARPRGLVIAWCLDLGEVLDIEDHRDVVGVVLVRVYEAHAPWITAHGAEHVGGEVVPAVDEAPAAVKAMVEGLSMMAVINQGLSDSRERSAAIQALTYFRDRGHQLDTAQLIAEALRNEWPRQSPLELARLAKEISAGKRPRFAQRLQPEVVTQWADAK